MLRRFITEVTPMEDHILQVLFVSGSKVLLDMKPHLDSVRFFRSKSRRCGAQPPPTVCLSGLEMWSFRTMRFLPC